MQFVKIAGTVCEPILYFESEKACPLFEFEFLAEYETIISLILLILGFVICFYGVFAQSFSIFCVLTLEIAYILTKLIFKFYLRAFIDEVGVESGIIIIFLIGLLGSYIFHKLGLFIISGSIGYILSIFCLKYVETEFGALQI